MSSNYSRQELFRRPHTNVFTMNLDLKVLLAEDGVENFVLSTNYCHLNALSTFSILYRLVKSFIIHAINRDLFSIAELIVSNILSSKFSIWMVASCTRNTKLGVSCSFQEQTSLFYKTEQKNLYSMLMTLKVLNTWQDYVFISVT